MPITEEQRKQRQQHIGSSDMAAILGLDPYRTAYDVWLEKKGMLTDRPPSEVMKAGSRFEDGVLDFAEERLGPLLRNQTRACPGTPLVANIDAIVESSGEPVEGKTTGLYGPVAEFWGENGSDQVPDRIIIQSHVHLICVGSAEVCHVPTFIGGRGFCMFEIPRNPKLAEIICARAIEFQEKHVQTLEPPVGSRASLQIVKLVRRVPEKVAAVDPEIVKVWLARKETVSTAKKELEKAEAALLTALGDAEAGLCGELGAITYLETHRKAYSVSESKFRTLRHKAKGL